MMNLDIYLVDGAIITLSVNRSIKKLDKKYN